jgi:hypothetical protein
MRGNDEWVADGEMYVSTPIKKPGSNQRIGLVSGFF